VLAALLTAFDVGPAFAGSGPEWLLRVPKTDAKYRYYVGRASDAVSESAGYSQAIQDAYEAAIRDNFGFSARVDRQDYQSITSASSTRRSLEASDRVQFKDFEQVDAFHEKTAEGRMQVWILFRYLITSIEAEKHRLAARGPSTDAPLFSEQGERSEAMKGVLEVVTQPSGAEVFIDGTRWGVTPLRIYGRLTSGKHQLLLDHPAHAPVEEELIIIPAVTVKVARVLTKAQGAVRIDSDPAGALITVGGKVLGKTPTSRLEFPAGERITFEITHPKSERMIQEVSLARHSLREIELKLVLKSEYLNASMDSKAPDMRSAESNRGGAPRELAAPSRLLASDLSASAASFWDRFGVFDWNLGFALGYHDKTLKSTFALQYLSLDAWLEKKFFGLIGVRASSSLDLAWGGSEDEVNMDGGSGSLSVLGYLIHTPARSLYGFYERTLLHHAYRSPTYHGADTHVRQFRKGMGVGYQSWGDGRTGWMLELGQFQHTDSEGMEGSRTYSGKLGVVFSF
jgi:hypothetical protein